MKGFAAAAAAVAAAVVTVVYGSQHDTLTEQTASRRLNRLTIHMIKINKTSLIQCTRVPTPIINTFDISFLAPLVTRWWPLPNKTSLLSSSNCLCALDSELSCRKLSFIRKYVQFT